MRLFPVLVCVAPFVASAQTGGIVITDVTLKLGDGRTMERANVSFFDGKITHVSQQAPAAGSGSVVINGSGKVLYPGFIDAYSTRLQKSAPEPKQEGRPDAGTVAPPFMWAGNRKGIYSDYSASGLLDFEKDSSSYENGITTTFLVPSKGSIRGAGAIVNLLPSTAKDRVLVDGPFGLSYRNGSGDGYPSNILGVVALMRQVLADAKSTAEGINIGSPKDNLKALTDLGPLLSGKRAGVFEVNLDREIERSSRLAAEFGFPFMIAGGRDAYKTIPLLTKTKASVLLMVDYNDEPSVEPDKDTVAPADRTPVEFKKERRARWKEQISAPVQVVQAGIPLAFSSGSSPSDYLKNIRVLIKNGLPVEDALKAMTITPAKLFGLDSQLGTVEVGKMANLVLMSGPMENDSSKVEGLWIAGTPIVDPTKGGVK